MRIPPLPLALGIIGVTAGGYWAIDHLVPERHREAAKLVGVGIDAALVAGYGGAALLTALGSHAPGNFHGWARMPSEISTLSRGGTCALVVPSIVGGMLLAHADGDL